MVLFFFSFFFGVLLWTSGFLLLRRGVACHSESSLWVALPSSSSFGWCFVNWPLARPGNLSLLKVKDVGKSEPLASPVLGLLVLLLLVSCVLLLWSFGIVIVLDICDGNPVALLIGFWVVLGTNLFGRSQEIAKTKPLDSCVVGSWFFFCYWCFVFCCLGRVSLLLSLSLTFTMIFPLLGDAWFFCVVLFSLLLLPLVVLSSSSSGWCCVLLSFYGRCCFGWSHVPILQWCGGSPLWWYWFILRPVGGAHRFLLLLSVVAAPFARVAWPPHTPLGGVFLFSLFWVVLFFSFLFLVGGTASPLRLLLLLWVVLFSSVSRVVLLSLLPSVGCCCSPV